MTEDLQLVVILIGVAAALLLSLDGMRLVFRGTRDYISSTLDANPLGARVAGSAAAIILFCSGLAFLVTLAAWIAGVKPFGKWDDPNRPG